MKRIPEKAGEEHRGVPPRPYLTREEANRKLEQLGFIISPDNLNYPPGFQKQKFVALQELLAGAIAEWVGMEFEADGEDGDAASAVAELEEWTEEWLVG